MEVATGEVQESWLIGNISHANGWTRSSATIAERGEGLVVVIDVYRRGIVIDNAIVKWVGDVLVNSTGEGTLGRIAQVKVPLENCTVDTHVTIVRPSPGIPIHYFGMAVMAWEPRFSTMGRGATNQTELSPGAIGEAEIFIPHKIVLKEFEEFAEAISAQVSNLVSQNQKLRAARDLLLPRLMSGDIQV